jgi:predicted enzyme related to lactoylglutathione lyase
VPQLVVHFEVIGRDPERLRTYFGELFGWAFDTPSPVAQEISDPESYGFLDLVTAEDGTGIRGGIGGGPSATATRSSTLASRRSRLRYSKPNASAAHASWVR